MSAFSILSSCVVDAMKTMASKAVTGLRLILGTRGYMAPEVARGEPATPAPS